jgi:hypothetical protein
VWPSFAPSATGRHKPSRRCGDQAEVLLRHRLAGHAEFGDRAERRGLRLLAAGVRVNLGVEHEDVDVAAGGDDVVEAAEADVVGPAVAADDPDALVDEVVGDLGERAGFAVVRPASALRRAMTRSRWASMPDFLGLVGGEDGCDEVVT